MFCLKRNYFLFCYIVSGCADDVCPEYTNDLLTLDL
jgi:hypothetical protein